METLDIKTLTDIIRAVDVEITAKRLSKDLGVSYSTFARARRTGSWPPSLTDGAMLGVLDACRTEHFAGDGDAFARFVLAQLAMRGVGTAALDQALADGYAAFASELLAQAHEAAPDGALVRLVPAPRRPEPPVADTPPASDQTAASSETPGREGQECREGDETDDGGGAGELAPVLPVWAHELIAAFPVAILLAVGAFGVPLSSLHLWVSSHQAAFAAICFTLAVCPACLGALVDAPLAWRAWAREHPDTHLTWDRFRRVAKYGAPEGVVAGAGRFNLTVPYLCYQPVCNLAAAACCPALLALVNSMPGFTAFFCDHAWSEPLKATIAVSYYIALEFMHDQCRKPMTGDPSTEVCENPDNYLPTRIHNWANTVFLVCVISTISIGLLGLAAFGMSHFHAVSAPPLLAWPYLQATLFFSFANLSPYAIRTQATGIGTLTPAMSALSLAFAFLAVVVFQPTPASVALAVACLTCLAVTYHWAWRAKRDERGQWLAAWEGTGAYPLVVTLTILTLLALGLSGISFP